MKEGQEYAILTNIIHQEWTGHSVKAHKDTKGLKSQSLRDHVTEAKLIFTALAELSRGRLRRRTRHEGLHQNSKAGRVAEALRSERGCSWKSKRESGWCQGRTICRRPRQKESCRLAGLSRLTATEEECVES